MRTFLTKFARRRNRRMAALAFFAIGMSMTQPALAQFFTGPIASGMGGAGRAAADPGESSYLNPASLGHLQRYYFSSAYGFGRHENEGEFSEFSLLLADGMPDNLLPGALSFVRRWEPGSPSEPGYRLDDLQLGTAGFPLRHLTFGLAIHRRVTQLSAQQSYTQYNLNSGFLFTPNESLGFGIVAYDFLPADGDVPVGLRLVPTYALGVHGVIHQILRVRLDLVRPDRGAGGRTDVMAGLETFFRPDFAFRLGGQWKETRNQHYLTAGLGYKGPRLSVDYSYQKDVRVAQGSRHLIDMWLPF
jgi:hypothetical protein